jgi:hypothetical protein
MQTNLLMTNGIEVNNHYRKWEQPVMVYNNGILEQQTWINFEPVWVRTFYGRITAPANYMDESTKIVLVNDVANVIKYYGCFLDDSGTVNGLGHQVNDYSNSYVWVRPNGDLMFWSKCNENRTNQPFYVTIEYTNLTS